MRDELYRNALEALPEHLAVLDSVGRVIATNRAWDLFAERNGAAANPSVSVGTNYLDVCRRAVMGHDACASDALLGIEDVLYGRREQFSMQYACHSPLEHRWFAMTVVPAGVGSRGAVVTHLNITKQCQAEMALRESEQRLRQAMSAAHAASWSVDLSSGEAHLEDHARDLLGLPRDVPITFATLKSHVAPEDRAAVEEALRQTMETGAQGHVELRIVVPNGPARWIACHSERRQYEDGPDILIGLVQDISEQKQREDQVRFLAHEVNHRSKNILSLVQAIARQTARRSSPEEFLDRFDARVQYLARAQDLLIKNDWKSVPILGLVIAELGPFSDLTGSRIDIDGPPLTIGAKATQALGMAIHELATNAAKYGALSCDQGHVQISWQLEGASESETFSLHWIESRGPDVVVPSRRGFGSFVISQMIETVLSGSVALTYAPDGLKWAFSCSALNILEAR